MPFYNLGVLCVVSCVMSLECLLSREVYYIEIIFKLLSVMWIMYRQTYMYKENI